MQDYLEYVKCRYCGNEELYEGGEIQSKCKKCRNKKCGVCKKIKECIETGFMFFCCKDCRETNLKNCKKCGKVTKIKDFTNFGSYKEFLVQPACQRCQS